MIVTQAKAGIQNILKRLDSGLRRNDVICSGESDVIFDIFYKRNRSSGSDTFP